MQTILGLVAAGVGVAVVPACMATLQRPDVRYLHLTPLRNVVETSAVWHAENGSPVLAALLAELPSALER